MAEVEMAGETVAGAMEMEEAAKAAAVACKRRLGSRVQGRGSCQETGSACSTCYRRRQS